MTQPHKYVRATTHGLLGSLATRVRRMDPILVVLLVALGSFSLGAQTASSGAAFYSDSNPARLSARALSIGLGTMSTDFYSSGLDIEEVLDLFAVRRTAGTNRRQFESGDVQTVLAQQSLQSFEFTYQSDAGLQFSLAHHLRARQYLRYPDALAGLLRDGATESVGTQVAAGPLVDAYGYQDYSLGVAVRAESKLQLGMRLHYLTGGAALFTERHRITLSPTTDGRYYPVATDVRVHTSGLGAQFAHPQVTDRLLGNTNRGLSLDIGAVLTPREGLEISAAVEGMGHIQWTADAHLHRSQGSYRVRGVPYHPSDEGSDASLGDVLETLEEALAFETTTASFRTTLPTTATLGVRYAANARTQTALTVGGIAYRGRFYSRLRGTIDRAIGERWRAGLLLSTVNFDRYLVGFQGAVALDGFTAFIVADHAPALFRPLRAHVAGLRLGTRIELGKAVQSY